MTDEAKAAAIDAVGPGGGAGSTTLPADEVARMSDDIVGALKSVYDPEIPADIYELGLIYKVDIADDRAVGRQDRGDAFDHRLVEDAAGAFEGLLAGRADDDDLREEGVEVATDDAALLDVMFGKASPTGKLPFDLPSDMPSVMAQAADAAHDFEDPLFRFGFGLTYPAK